MSELSVITDEDIKAEEKERKEREDMNKYIELKMDELMAEIPSNYHVYLSVAPDGFDDEEIEMTTFRPLDLMHVFLASARNISATLIEFEVGKFRFLEK